MHKEGIKKKKTGCFKILTVQILSLSLAYLPLYILNFRIHGCFVYYLFNTVKHESEVVQSCLTLGNPMDCRLLSPWDSLGKNTVVGCHFLFHLIQYLTIKWKMQQLAISLFQMATHSSVTCSLQSTELQRIRHD